MKAIYSYFLFVVFLTYAYANEQDSLAIHTSQETYCTTKAY